MQCRWKLLAVLLALALLCACAAPPDADSQDAQTPDADPYRENLDWLEMQFAHLAGDERLDTLAQALVHYDALEYEACIAMFEQVFAIGGDEELTEAVCMWLYSLYLDLGLYDEALQTLQTGAAWPGTDTITGILDALLLPPDTVGECSGAVRAYPYSTTPVWVAGGDQLAVAEGRLIRYIGLDNEPVREALLDTVWFGTLDITDDMIVSTSRYPGVLLRDGAWTLYDVAFFAPDGSLLGRGDTLDELTLGRLSDDLEDGSAEWDWVSVVPLDAEHAALVSQTRVFLYQPATGALTLADDLSEWIAARPEPETHGNAAAVHRDGAGAYYLRYDQEQEEMATVWHIDATGARMLFDGQSFASLTVRNGLMILKDTHDGDQYQWAATADLELHPVTLENSSGIFRIDGTRISAPAAAGIHCIETQSGELSLYLLPEMLYTYAGTRVQGGSLQIIFTDAEQSDCAYLYDVGSDALHELPWFETPVGFELHSTHYLETTEGEDGMGAVRVLPLAPLNP